MFKDNFDVSGNLSIVLYDNEGNIKDSRKINNLVVTTGKTWIAARMQANTSAVMTHMSIGSGNTDPVIADTALGTELGRVTLANTGGYQVANTVTYDATFPAGTGTGAITEAGIFNTANTMLARTKFGIITKGALDTLSVSWVVSVS